MNVSKTKYAVKHLILLFAGSLIISCVSSCRNSSPKESPVLYPTRSYTDLEQLNIRLPYVKKYGAGKQVLVFGSNHTMDPSDPQIALIEEQIRDFKPALILYEGDGISTEKTKAETISTFSEMGLVLYLADSLKIKTKNIEPPAKDKYAYLLGKYPKSEVLLATLGLMIAPMQIEKENFENKYPVMIRTLSDEGFPLGEEERTIDYFYKIYRDYFKHDFSYENFDSRTIQAKYNATSLNRINQDANRYRDQYIIALIDKELKTYERIYLQVGGWHAIVCEPAFSEIVH